MQESTFWDAFGRRVFFNENEERDYNKEYKHHYICPERFKQESAYACGPEEIKVLTSVGR